jgi:hypothetical protein
MQAEAKQRQGRHQRWERQLSPGSKTVRLTPLQTSTAHLPAPVFVSALLNTPVAKAESE